jgi:hypothetical protein
MAPIRCSGPWGKLICKINQKLKISYQAPFKVYVKTIDIFGFILFGSNFLGAQC